MVRKTPSSGDSQAPRGDYYSDKNRAVNPKLQKEAADAARVAERQTLVTGATSLKGRVSAKPVEGMFGINVPLRTGYHGNFKITKVQ